MWSKKHHRSASQAVVEYASTGRAKTQAPVWICGRRPRRRVRRNERAFGPGFGSLCEPTWLWRRRDRWEIPQRVGVDQLESSAGAQRVVWSPDELLHSVFDLVFAAEYLGGQACQTIV